MLRAAVWKLAPRRVSRVRTHAQLARFKQEQREFDKVVLELQLASPSEIEAHNSIAHPDEPIHMTANNPDFAVQMNVAESLSRRYRNALSELAK